MLDTLLHGLAELLIGRPIAVPATMSDNTQLPLALQDGAPTTGTDESSNNSAYKTSHTPRSCMCIGAYCSSAKMQLVPKTATSSVADLFLDEFSPTAGMDGELEISAFEMHQRKEFCRCYACIHGARGNCRYERRLEQHMEKVHQIMNKCYDKVATILVGPGAEPMICHKALLGFFSGFFDGALYGHYPEAENAVVKMPETTVAEMQAFLCWCYTGQIDTHLSGEEIWILADKLMAKDFANEAMYFLFDMSYENRLPAQAAKYVYDNTMPSSALRRFVADLIVNKGPLIALDTGDVNQKKERQFHSDWHKVIEEGGELVLDAVKKGSNFANESEGYQERGEVPYQKPMAPSYISKSSGRAIEDFLNDVPRSR